MARIPNVKVQVFARDSEGSFGNVEEVLRDEFQIERFEYSEDDSISPGDSNVINQLNGLLPPAVTSGLDNSGLLMVFTPEEEVVGNLAACQCQCGMSGSCGGGGGGH
jgi:hypothetical protein